MSLRSCYDLANEAFVSDDLEEALKLYKLGFEAKPYADACFAGASQVFLREENFSEALHHANKALELNPANETAHFRKGIALFNLGKVLEAKTSFEEVLKVKAQDPKVTQWLSKCNQSSISNKSPISLKYDWYQSESDVVVTVLVKDVHPEDVKHEITDRSLTITINHRNGSQFYMKMYTLHAIVPEESKLKFLPTKIEAKLKKLDGIRWEKLEMSNAPSVHESEARNSNKSTTGPEKDWNKLVNQVKEEEKHEELEGEAALNKLFQQIYADGSDDVKKAMLKSYSESGGTVLSTNWNEIGKQKVEVQPPDGMEFKKWD